MILNRPAVATTRPMERNSRLPDFLVIGAMKAGTTTLYRALAQHPSIFMCKPKEPQFFSRTERFECRSSWYRQLFKNARQDQVCGEASTCYTRWPHYEDVPERIASTIPNARFLYLMRHPVERCYSHYGHRMQEKARKNEPIITFEEYLEEDAEAVNTSLYMQQIKRFLSCFPRERFLFLTLDDLLAEPDATMRAVFRFLGLAAPNQPLMQSHAENARGANLARARVQQVLHKVRHANGVRQIAECVPTDWRRNARRRLAELIMESSIGSLIRHRFDRSLSPLTSETRSRLLRRFRKPTRELEWFLNRELPQWHV